jgi:hypothetical protein
MREGQQEKANGRRPLSEGRREKASRRRPMGEGLPEKVLDEGLLTKTWLEKVS